MDKTGKGTSQERRRYGQPTSQPTTAWQNAQASAQRQARWALWRPAGAIALVCAVGFVAGPSGLRADDGPPPAQSGSPQARAAARAMLEARERRLRDEQRVVEGRIQALDRRLDLREAERERLPLTDPGGEPAPLQDPVAERWQIERRGLVDRDRGLEQRLRNEQFDRQRKSRVRSW